jgi:hypothetical protein
MGKKKVGAKAGSVKEDVPEITKDDHHQDQEAQQELGGDVDNKNDEEPRDLLEEEKQVGLSSEGNNTGNEDLEEPSCTEAPLNAPVEETNHENAVDEPPIPLAGAQNDSDAGDCHPQENEASPEKPILQESDKSSQGDEEEEDEGPWELTKILTMTELSNGCPIKCFTADCPLPAAVLYVSTTNQKFTYYYCLDCQVRWSIYVGQYSYVFG